VSLPTRPAKYVFTHTHAQTDRERERERENRFCKLKVTNQEKEE